MDCCFDFLDVVKVKEKNNLKCIKPLIEAKKMGFFYTQSYHMIDICSSNVLTSCKTEIAALWGSLYPVNYIQSSEIQGNIVHI